LLDSYSTERVHATHENIAYGAKSTEFMAPPDFAFRLMREAALRLAVDDTHVRALINPRQSSPIEYSASPLNAGEDAGWTNALATPGAPAPEAMLRDEGGDFHLSQRFGHGFVCLVFGGAAPHLPADVQALHIGTAMDVHGQAWQRYGLRRADEAALVLVRPDGYVMGRWHGLDGAHVAQALQSTGVSE
jgi:3-(3-hydroxy-phenyl)propionate hydroxylase